METAIIPLEMQSVGENDIFKAGEQKPNARGTLTRLGTPSQHSHDHLQNLQPIKLFLKHVFQNNVVGFFKGGGCCWFFFFFNFPKKIYQTESF